MGLHKDRAEMSQFLSGTWGIKYCAIKEKNTYLAYYYKIKMYIRDIKVI